MKAEQNELITRIGAGTPCGALMRRYWQPVALVDEFDPALDPRMAQRPVKAVRALGQDLVLFRERPGRLGLAGSRLPAPRRRPVLRPPRRRRPALPLPWLEVRRHRRMPGNAGRTRRQQAVRTGAPAQLPGAGEERRAVRLAGRRRSAPPPFPDFDCFAAPATHTFAFKGLWHCQLAAGLRGGHRSGPSLVPAPLPATTRRWKRSATTPRASSSAAPAPAQFDGEQWPMTRIMREFAPARDQLRDHALGHAAHGAAADDRRAHARARHPRHLSAHLRDPAVGDADHHADARAGGRHPHLLVFVVHQLRRVRWTRKPCAAQRLQFITLPDYIPKSGRHNHWGFNPEEQRRRPTWAWARTTSTCTTSGPWKAWAPSRTARASTWAPATR